MLSKFKEFSIFKLNIADLKISNFLKAELNIDDFLMYPNQSCRSFNFYSCFELFLLI